MLGGITTLEAIRIATIWLWEQERDGQAPRRKRSLSDRLRRTS